MTQKSRRRQNQKNLHLSKELAPQERQIRRFLKDNADPRKVGKIDVERYEFLSISDSDLLGLPCKQVEVPTAVFAAMQEQHRQLMASLRAKRLGQR